MNVSITNYLSIPFAIRVAIWSFLFVFIILKYGSKIFRYFFSILILLLKKCFQVLYLFVETPISILHQKTGLPLYKIENQMTDIGEKINDGFEKGYSRCKSAKDWSFKVLLVVYIVMCVIVIVPTHMENDNNVIKAGEHLYNKCEKKVISILLSGTRNSDNPSKLEETENAVLVSSIENRESEIDKQTDCGIVLIVTGVKSTLAIRDIPEIENSNILKKLVKGDTVTWNGEMCFSKLQDENFEIWVRVISDDEVQGWSRLSYLCPETYENVTFMVHETTELIDATN